MKTVWPGLVLTMVALLSIGPAQAQYRGARNYFPKNSPAPDNSGTQGAAPAAPAAQDKAPAAKPPQPKFKDLEVNATFYFLTDTNRTYAWTKLTTTTAKNTKNGVVTTIYGSTPIQR